ncbi:MAG: hypothetical protein FWB75_05550 [Oscillospiraceae bacterium]|nr:hypothetical protein [Oscillospiraceae bacterium]
MKSSTELIIGYLEKNPFMSKAVTAALLTFTAYGVYFLGSAFGTAIGHFMNFMGL